MSSIVGRSQHPEELRMDVRRRDIGNRWNGYNGMVALQGQVAHYNAQFFLLM